MKKELELYVHIPFCVKKCAYCDFLSFSAKQEEVSAYVEALAEEIKGKKEQFSDYCVTTIFLGGGTPSILEGVYTASIFRALRESFDIAENAEITMEVNPGTVSEEKINMWKTCARRRSGRFCRPPRGAGYARDMPRPRRRCPSAAHSA